MEMYRYNVLLKILIVFCIIVFASSCKNDFPSEKLIDIQVLSRNFDTPPQSAKPWVYLWWMGYISKENITKELEALKSKGIGGAIIFQCDDLPHDVFKNRKEVWTPEWNEMVAFALEEAERLDLKLSINYVDMSAGCGGPWISADESGQTLVWAPLWTTGGKHVDLKLPQPKINHDVYHDVAVLAYPCDRPWGLMYSANPVISSSSDNIPYMRKIQDGFDRAFDSYWESRGSTPGGDYIDLKFPEPFTASGFVCIPKEGWSPLSVDIQTSVDGKEYTSLYNYMVTDKDSISFTFSSISSRYFRVVFPKTERENRVILREFRLLAEGESADELYSAIPFFGEQIASIDHTGESLPYFYSGGALNKSHRIDTNLKGIINLSDKLDSEGVLHWDAPSGNWMILRFGHTVADRVQLRPNQFNVDFLNPATAVKHFTDGIDPFLKTIGYKNNSSLKFMHEDSFEQPFNRWTHNFSSEFKRLRGYDITPWLPVLAGCVVEDLGSSERFLWDYRRTIADLYLSHWETIRNLCHERGLLFESEAAGPHSYCHDYLGQLGRTDYPMGEFWSQIYIPGIELDDQPRGCWGFIETVKQASSAAHTYGMNVVSAEAFTSYARPFVADPFDIKAHGDRALCDGLNRFVIHLWMNQPMEEYNGKPALVRLHGFDFNRRSTWFEQSTFWTDYLSRCSAMLQSGNPVADIAYFVGEGAPSYVLKREMLEPAMPWSYDYDACNSENILSSFVKDNRICLPSGRSYSLLVMHPSLRSMTPALLSKLESLVRSGASILCPKPEYSPSLSNHVEADDYVRKTANAMWGESSSSGVHSYGKGKVFWGKEISEVMEILGCRPAFQALGNNNIIYVQRQISDSEIYFVSNQAKEDANFIASIRLSSGTDFVPEFWDPSDGSRKPVNVYEIKDDRINIPMHLDERGSVFIVLRQSPSAYHFLSVERDGDIAYQGQDYDISRTDGNYAFTGYLPGIYTITDSEGLTHTLEIASILPVIDLSTDWQLNFKSIDKNIVMDSLQSWTELDSDSLRYYSGTTVYRKSFTLDPSCNGKVILDLGSLKNICELHVNGHKVGLAWKPPYKFDVTSYVRNGINDIEIEITNLLHNRISGDFLVPESERAYYSFGAIDQYRDGTVTGKDKLLPSGLFGPVLLYNYNKKVLKKY